jgi:hypothetical protein
MAIGIDEDDTGRFLQFSSLDAEEGAGSAGCGSVDAQDGTQNEQRQVSAAPIDCGPKNPPHEHELQGQPQPEGELPNRGRTGRAGVQEHLDVRREDGDEQRDEPNTRCRPRPRQEKS